MGIKTLNLAVFISGSGSNLQALIDACAQDDYPARIGVVFSNKPDAYGLVRAENAGIPTETIEHTSYESRTAFDAAMLETLGKYEVDLICLAGFMRILTPDFITPWTGRIINIHPSLLPDYKGQNTHARVLADGKAESGCSVHYVVPDVDSGEIIVQKRVPVVDGDTPDSLAARILEQEHIAYPEAVRLVAEELLKNS